MSPLKDCLRIEMSDILYKRRWVGVGGGGGGGS
jgi:hypothetical protein